MYKVCRVVQATSHRHRDEIQLPAEAAAEARPSWAGPQARCSLRATAARDGMGFEDSSLAVPFVIPPESGATVSWRPPSSAAAFLSFLGGVWRRPGSKR